MAAARILAVKCLLDMENGAFSNLAFKKRINSANPDARDVQFISRLFYGTLERTVTLDYILSGFVKGGVHKLDAEVRAIMRSGLYQCLYMDSVPNSAAVNESVELCARFRKKSAAGMVNAVLRKACRFDMSVIDNIIDETSRLSVKYSVCRGLAEMFLNQYGAQARDILAATLERMPVSVRVNTLKTTVNELKQRLSAQGIKTESTWLPGALSLTSGRYMESPALAEGLMRVQSLAAQYAVWALNPKPGESILDICAAPGGKTLTSLQIMNNEGSVLAVDIHEKRLALIDEQAAREGITNVITVCADAVKYNSDVKFDAVLCDLPCSGYGEMAQKPELRLKEPGTGLCILQNSILQNAAGLVASGGRIVYSTCTLDKRENEDVVDNFLAKNDVFCAVAPKNVPVHAKTVGNYIKFLPKSGFSEGFFIATLERMW